MRCSMLWIPLCPPGQGPPASRFRLPSCLHLQLRLEVKASLGARKGMRGCTRWCMTGAAKTSPCEKAASTGLGPAHYDLATCTARKIWAALPGGMCTEQRLVSIATDRPSINYRRFGMAPEQHLRCWGAVRSCTAAQADLTAEGLWEKMSKNRLTELRCRAPDPMKSEKSCMARLM